MESLNPQLSEDDVLKVLSNAQRRKLLDSLISDSQPNDAVSSGIAVDVDTAMYHNHLTKLADYGLIDWDRETNRVTKGPNFEASAEKLACLANNSGIPSPEGGRGMTEEDDCADASDREYGITDDDMEQIEVFSEKQRFERSPDDLRRTSKR